MGKLDNALNDITKALGNKKFNNASNRIKDFYKLKDDKNFGAARSALISRIAEIVNKDFNLLDKKRQERFLSLLRDNQGSDGQLGAFLEQLETGVKVGGISAGSVTPEVVDEKIEDFISELKKLPVDNLNNFKNNISSSISKGKELNKLFEIISKVPNLKRDYELLDNSLMTDIQDYRNKMLKNKDPDFQKVLFDELAKVLTVPARTSVFLKGAEREAGVLKRREVEEVKKNLNNLSLYLIRNFDQLSMKKFTNIKELTDQFVKPIMDLIDDSMKKDIEAELRKMHNTAKDLAKRLETSRDPRYTPIYQRMTFFYWNMAGLFDFISRSFQEIRKTKKNVEELKFPFIEEAGDAYAELFENSNKIFYNDRSLVVDFINKKRTAFVLIYDGVFARSVNLFNKLSVFVSGLNDLVTKLVNVKASKKDKVEFFNSLKQDDVLINEMVTVISTLDKSSIKSINEAARDNVVSLINADINKRFGSLGPFVSEGVLNDFIGADADNQKLVIALRDILFKLQQFISSESYDIKLAKEITDNFKVLLDALKSEEDSLNSTLRDYSKSIDNFNRFVLRNRIMFGEQVIPKTLDLVANANLKLTGSVKGLDRIRLDNVRKKVVAQQIIEDAKKTNFSELISKMEKGVI